MKNFKYSKHGHSEEMSTNVKKTKYMQRFRGSRKINLPRLIFTLILIYAGLVTVSYLVNKLFFVTGKGVVISSNYPIKMEEDVAINKFWVNVGDKIKTGDTLFSYQSSNQIKEIKEYNKRKESRINSYNKERNELTKNINLREINKQYHKRLYRNKKKHINKLKEEVYLDVSKRTDLNKAQIQATDLYETIRFLDDEIKYLKRYRYQIKSNYSTASDRNGISELNISKARYLTSILDGTVKSTTQAGFILDKSYELMVIKKDEGVIIIANIPQSSMRQIDEGEELKIKFSDGYRSKAIVKEVLEPTIDPTVTNSRQLDEMTKIHLKLIPIKGEEKEWISRIGFTIKIKKAKVFF